MAIIIINKDGSQTQPMEQAQAESYLGTNKRGKGLLTLNLVGNLKQALNDVTSLQGKATADYTFNGQNVLHASSGIMGVKSVTLFFYRMGVNNYIFAMGEHVASDTYEISVYGQQASPYREGDTIYASLKDKQHAERAKAALNKK